MNQQSLSARIKSETEKIFSNIVEFRRHLHMNPELSFEEKETSAFISSVLTEHKIPHDTGVGGFGIVAKLEGSGSGPNILLRADMDALPIHEKNEVDYRSKKDGIMHACGHDAHTSSLLGSVIVLNRLKKQWAGNIIAIFQPAEEKIPGGAKAMIDDGLLEKYQPEMAFGQHVHPPLDSGKVAFIEGPAMASADELHLRVKGRGGHAALIRDCIDPVPVAAEIISNIQHLVSRKCDPFVPTVVSIGSVNTIGGSFNVIPSEVQMSGTIRTFNEEWRYELHKLLERLCSQISAAHGAACEVNILKGYPFLHNSPEITKKARNYAEVLLGKNNVVTMDQRMTAEDFAYFGQQLPSCFFRLGTRKKGKAVTPVHTPEFDLDENALFTGSICLSWLAVNKY